MKLFEIYFANIDNPSLLDLILYKCYKLNNYSSWFKGKLDKLIFKLEHWKFGDHEEKLIECLPINLLVETEKSFRQATHFYRTKAYKIWKVTLEDGRILTAADKHLIWASRNYDCQWRFIKDLSPDDWVYTDDGWLSVESIVETPDKAYMCDITIDSNNHSYYTNGILSHNTTTTICYLLHTLLFHEQKSCLVVANKGRTGKEIIKKMKEVIEDLPYFMKPGIMNLSEERISFENGSYIITAAASKAPATGDTLNLLYIDEAALIPNNVIDEYWASVYPTMSSLRTSQIILSSTPRGKTNLFYKFYNGALTGTMKGWKCSRTDWWEVPEHDEEWLEQQKQDLGEALFKREIELSFETADNRLASTYAMQMMKKLGKDFICHDFYNIPDQITKNIIWAPDFDPTFLSYEQLKNRRFLFMIDLAQGIEEGAFGKKDSDYNIINIFEIEPMSSKRIEFNRRNNPITTKDVVQYKQVGVYMDNMKTEETCAEAAKYIAFNIFKCGFHDIDSVRILVEMNFNGRNWLNKFKQHPMFYNALILKTLRGNAESKDPKKYKDGFVTKGGAHGKNYYCDAGAEMLDKRQILVRQKNDDNINRSTIGQISQFCKNPSKNTYQGQGCHDDLAVTTLFISIAPECSGYIQWINEWLETTIYWPEKITKIQYMLNIYVEKEVLLSEEESAEFYQTASQGFNKLTHQQNGYGSLMMQLQQSMLPKISLYPLSTRYPYQRYK